jgi:hypothetical protein
MAAMLGGLLALGIAAGPASAAPTTHVPTAHVAAVHVVSVVAPATPTPTPTTNYNKGQQQANAALAKQKLIIGGICAVLLVIVYFGHRAKGKHVLRLRNLQNAKS